MNNETAITNIGNRDEIVKYAQRIGYMVPGGSKLYDNEKMALAQIAYVTGLSPFTGEIWYIHEHGPMVGIAGSRKLANLEAKANGGYVWEEFISVSPEEAGANAAESKDCAGAFHCIVHDTTADTQFQTRFMELLTSLREAGDKDPVGTARAIIGNKPVWEGWGFSTKAEKSRMNKIALAKKRAHADALKKKIVIPFGGGTVSIAAADVAPGFNEEGEVVDAQAEDVDAEGVDMAFPPPDEPEPPQKSKAVPRPPENKAKTQKPDGPVGILLDLGVTPTGHAANLTNNLKLDSSMSRKEIETIYSQYEDLKADGKTSVEAAEEILKLRKGKK